MEKHTDEFLLTKAILKLSCALENLDNLVFFNQTEKKFLREFEHFGNWFTKYAREFTVEMALSDWESYNEIVYKWSDWFDKAVDSETENKKYLYLFIAKIYSALKDLLDIENYSISEELVSRLKIVLSIKFISKNMRKKQLLTVINGFEEMFREILG